MSSEGSTSPWVYIGLGCLLAVLLAVGSCVGLAYFGARQVKQMVDDMEDPEKRSERVGEVLGMDEPPAGYYPSIAFSVPFVLDMAVLSDRPPKEGDTDPEPGNFEQRGFIYVNSRTFGDDLEEMRDFLRGEDDRSEAFGRLDIGVDMDHDEVVARGEFTREEIDYLWAAYRGRVDTEEGDLDGIAALIAVDCRRDDRLRLGIWMGPDPAPDSPPEELEVEGTPADGAAIEAFMGHFELCG